MAAASHSLTLVTGASSNHFEPALHLLASLQQHAPGVPVVFFDLGLEPYEAGIVGQLAELRPFPFDRYPPHVAVLCKFAWKPIIVAEMLAERGPILWMDAGNMLHWPLDKAAAAVEAHGVYAPVLKRPFSVGDYTHPDTARALGASAEVLGRKFRHAAVVGLHPRVAELVRRWREAALDESVIAPPGTVHNENHHFDQSIWSILLYQSGLFLEDRWFGITVCSDSTPHLTWEELAERCAQASTKS